MKTSKLQQHGVSPAAQGLMGQLVAEIPWPARRRAMGMVAATLMDGKVRACEDAFGWARSTVTLGLHEYRSGITCRNDLGRRRRPKVEHQYPQVLVDLKAIMEPDSQADPHLRTTLQYTNMTAAAVRTALLAKGWTDAQLPTVRTISSLLNRLQYRLRTVAKTKVQKKRLKRTPSSPTSAP